MSGGFKPTEGPLQRAYESMLAGRRYERSLRHRSLFARFIGVIVRGIRAALAEPKEAGK